MNLQNIQNAIHFLQDSLQTPPIWDEGDLLSQDIGICVEKIKTLPSLSEPERKITSLFQEYIEELQGLLVNSLNGLPLRDAVLTSIIYDDESLPIVWDPWMAEQCAQPSKPHILARKIGEWIRSHGLQNVTTKSADALVIYQEMQKPEYKNLLLLQLQTSLETSKNVLMMIRFQENIQDLSISDMLARSVIEETSKEELKKTELIIGKHEKELKTKVEKQFIDHAGQVNTLKTGVADHHNHLDQAVELRKREEMQRSELEKQLRDQQEKNQLLQTQRR